MTETHQFPRLAGVGDIGRLVTRDRVSTTWPPPGTSEIRVGFPEVWVDVIGEPSEGGAGDWYVTTLAHVAGITHETVAQLLLRIGAVFTGPIALYAGTVGQWPVIYEVGRGNKMRWVSTIIRGTLGGVEDFQFGINFGNPGADPDPNEAECLATAETLAGIVQSALATPHFGSQTMLGILSPTCVFTEVGVVVKEQSSGTDADGSGGDLSQKFDTQWFAYPVGGKPTGSSGVSSLPYEVATAVTLQTDKRGQSGRGRLYLPPLHVNAMAAGGVYTSAIPDVTGKFVGEILEEMTSAKGWVPVVVSRRRIFLNEVKSVSVGIVPDSQRRRRRNQDEARVEAWVTP